MKRPADGKCPAGLVLCPGSQDSENGICATSFEECPITKISIVKAPKLINSNSKTRRLISYEKVFLDKNFNLEFSKETNNLPIAYSKLDFGHPCLNQSEIQGEVSPPDYQDLLMLNFPSETQKYGCSFDFAN